MHGVEWDTYLVQEFQLAKRMNQVFSRRNGVSEMASLDEGLAMSHALEVRMNEERRQLYERLRSALSEAQTYTAIVIFGAYAALFTIWTYTKEHMDRTMTFWVAALLGASVLVFVAFEVFKVAVNGAANIRISAFLKEDYEPEEFFAEHRALVKDQLKFEQLVLAPLWLAVLVITIVTGFGAAALLFYVFASGLAAGTI